jgi:hypothetical protein
MTIAMMEMKVQSLCDSNTSKFPESREWFALCAEELILVMSV